MLGNLMGSLIDSEGIVTGKITQALDDLSEELNENNFSNFWITIKPMDDEFNFICEVFHHLEINYCTSIDILNFHRRNVTDHQLAISFFDQRAEECCVVSISQNMNLLHFICLRISSFPLCPVQCMMAGLLGTLSCKTSSRSTLYL